MAGVFEEGDVGLEAEGQRATGGIRRPLSTGVEYPELGAVRHEIEMVGVVDRYQLDTVHRGTATDHTVIVSTVRTTPRDTTTDDTESQVEEKGWR